MVEETACKVDLPDEKIAEVAAYSQDMPLSPSGIHEYEEYFTYAICMENDSIFLPTNVQEVFNFFQPFSMLQQVNDRTL